MEGPASYRHTRSIYLIIFLFSVVFLFNYGYVYMHPCLQRPKEGTGLLKLELQEIGELPNMDARTLTQILRKSSTHSLLLKLFPYYTLVPEFDPHTRFKRAK